MSHTIFAARSRKQDMMSLSGWLFADLLLGLMMIFLVSVPPRAVQPPTLLADVSELSPTDKHCHGGITDPVCVITVSEGAKSDGAVNWTSGNDMSEGVQFSPVTGTLKPGQSVTITIAKIPCQTGSFTFKGPIGVVPLIIPWKCQLPPVQVQLETNATSFSLNISDVQGLLNNSSQVIDDLKQQIKNKPALTNRSVGIAIVYDGAPTDADTGQAQNISNDIYDVMRSLQNDPTFHAFQRASYYDPLFKLNTAASTVLVDVYLFKQ